MGKVIFLAIDNTLRDFDGTIPASGIEAIRIAQRNGHEVLLNTGRTHFRIGERIMNIGFDGVIANSGGYVEYKGEHIGHRSFTQLAFIELMRDLLECQCTVEMENSKASYILRESVEAYREIGRRVRQSMNLREDEMTGPIAVESLLDVPEVQKLIVFSNHASREAILSKWGYSFHIMNLAVPYIEKWAGTITPNYITKAEGIRLILKERNGQREDAVAIGDNDCDIEMIRYAGTGIAMGNGSENIKAAADYVTAPLKEDGVWKAFEHLGLLG